MSDLLKAFGITEADLAANRSGRLGEHQVNKLRRSGVVNVALAFVLGLGLAAVMYFVAHKPLKPVQWILALAMFGAVLAAGINHFKRTAAAAAEGTAECLAGPVEVRSRGKAGFYVHVAGRSFRCPVRPWNITNGTAYRVYIAPRANMIVAMEPGG